MFDGTKPLCRPWQSTPLQPLAGSHIRLSPGKAGQLEILWDTGACRDASTFIMLVCLFLCGLLYVFTIIGTLVAFARNLFHGDSELLSAEGCGENAMTVTGLAWKSLQLFQALRMPTSGAPRPDNSFNASFVDTVVPGSNPAAGLTVPVDNMSISQLEGHLQQEAAPLHSLGDLDHVHAAWGQTAEAARAYPPSFAAPATDGCLGPGGGGVLPITSLLTSHPFFWCAAFVHVQVWAMIFVANQMFSVCIVLRGTGFSVSHDGWPWRPGPLRAVWRLLVKMACFTPSEDFREPVLGAKVCFPQYP